MKEGAGTVSASPASPRGGVLGLACLPHASRPGLARAPRKRPVSRAPSSLPPSLPPSLPHLLSPGQVGPSSLISVLRREPLEAPDPDKLWLVALQVGVRLPPWRTSLLIPAVQREPPTSLTPRGPEEAALAPVPPPPRLGPLTSPLWRVCLCTHSHR